MAAGGDSDLTLALRLLVDTSQAGKLSGVLSDTRKGFQEVRDSADQVVAVLDKYDRAGANIRRLKTDFAALSDAAKQGLVGDKDAARYEQVMRAIQGELGAVRGGMEGMAQAATHGAFATAGFTRELIVLGHEAMSGNFSRMPGSMMVLASRAGMLSGSFLAMGGAAVAVVAPFLAFGIAIQKGAEQQHELQQALALTGNFAGLTETRMRALAEEMARAGNVTIGEARGIVQAYVASGRIGSEAIERIAKLTDDFARATGKDAAEAAKELTRIFADPAKGAEELTKAWHFLDAQEQARIATLMQLGKLGEAQLVLADALGDKLTASVKPVGTLERAWNALKKAASDTWDAMTGAGRAETAGEKLGRLTSFIEQQGGDIAAARRGAKPGFGGTELEAAYAQYAAAEKAAQKEQLLAQANEAATKAIEANKLAEEKRAKALQESVAGYERLKEAMQKAMETSRQEAEQARTAAAVHRQAAEDARSATDERLTNMRLKGLSPEEQADAAGAAANRAMVAAESAQTHAAAAQLAGDNKEMQRQLERAAKLAEQAQGLGERAGSERQVQEAGDIKARVLEQQAAAEEAKAKAADERAAGQAKTLQEIETRVAQMKVDLAGMGIEIKGIEEAKAKLAEVKAAVDAIPSQKVIEIAWSSGGAPVLPGNPGQGALGMGAPAFAAGGPIRGPGGPTDDRVLLLGSAGEFMMRAAAVRHYGAGFMSAVNRLQIPKFSGGGPVGSSRQPINLSWPGGGPFRVEATEEDAGRMVALFQRESLKRGRRG